MPLVRELMARLEGEQVSLAVSSLRAYGLPEALLDDIAKVRATSLTFAPEAGSQRMRDVVNKNITEEQILESARRVFSRRWNAMKLYFMIGLPTETMDDVRAIVETGVRCRDVAKELPDRQRDAQVTCSVSSFVPKPHTPFQWCAMDDMAHLGGKQHELLQLSRRHKIRLKWHDPEGSYLEGILSRGDRRLAELIEGAYRKGCRFDSWDEHFRFDHWMETLAELGIDETAYLGTLPVDATLPWDHIDPGVTKEFLALEYRRSLKDRLSAPCGKPKGAIVHPPSLDEAASPDYQERQLVCYHCGVACDLTAMKGERVEFHEQLEKLGEVRPEHRELEPRAYRFVYVKEGTALTLSHLDLLRIWPRALRRAGLPVAYSQGYHPHPRLSFTPALPMGMPSLGEQVEIMLRSDLPPAEVMEQLDEVMPEGIRLLEGSADESPRMSLRLRSLRMLVRFTGGEGDLATRCAELTARESIEVERERKRRLRRIEMRPTLKALRPATPEEIAEATTLLGAEAPGEDTVLVELQVQGAALKAGELVELLRGEADSLRGLRLGFELEEAKGEVTA